jgi:DNA invertase Pin-like site-specific DNA recombinase
MQKHNIFGYIRVSTQEQHIERQYIALKPFKIPRHNLYIDRQSGKDFNRPGYQTLLQRLQQGDLLIVKSIDRLGRDYQDIIEQWRLITRIKGSDIKILDIPLLDTSYAKDLLGTFVSDLILQILSYNAQVERDNLRQRQSEGIAAAKARGTVFGKAPLPLPPDFPGLFAKWRAGILSAKETAALCGFGRTTLYNKTKNLRSNGK